MTNIGLTELLLMAVFLLVPIAIIGGVVYAVVAINRNTRALKEANRLAASGRVPVRPDQPGATDPDHPGATDPDHPSAPSAHGRPDRSGH